MTRFSIRAPADPSYRTGALPDMRTRLAGLELRTHRIEDNARNAGHDTGGCGSAGQSGSVCRRCHPRFGLGPIREQHGRHMPAVQFRFVGLALLGDTGAGIAAEDIVQLAREYATARPAVIRLNYGLQRSERGAQTVRTLALLPVLTGSWKEVGGGLQLSVSQAFHLNRGGLERADLQQKALGRDARLINMTLLGETLTTRADPPVKALVVYNSNPAAIAPNQNAVLTGLSRDDLFTVVLEQFQNDTADFADILLPVTTFLEHTDLYFAYGHYYLQLARPALPRPGENRSNVEIFRQLAGAASVKYNLITESELQAS